MHILAVDDSEDGRDIIEAMLLSAGYEEINTKGSAVETFAFLGIGKYPTQAATPVDLILLDIVMPDMDGIETCAHIRSDHRYADVPIIMVTNLSDMDSLSIAFV